MLNRGHIQIELLGSGFRKILINKVRQGDFIGPILCNTTGLIPITEVSFVSSGTASKKISTKTVTLISVFSPKVKWKFLPRRLLLLNKRRLLLSERAVTKGLVMIQSPT